MVQPAIQTKSDQLDMALYNHLFCFVTSCNVLNIITSVTKQKKLILFFYLLLVVLNNIISMFFFVIFLFDKKDK